MSTLRRVAPIFAVRDLAASLAYYQRLGFTTREYEGGGYGFVTRNRVEIHLGTGPDVQARRGAAYIWVEDADELAATWSSAGADVRAPVDTEWQQHEGALIDPDGNVIRFGSPIADAAPTTRRLHPAIVLGTSEDECTVYAQGQPKVVAYAPFFPRPRAERVRPGHLVAVDSAVDGSAVVVWRWFDALVIDADGQSVRLWEPSHGTVIAQARNLRQRFRPGTRAYLSAGLPGADWWVAGPVVGRAENADVELDDVEQFLADLG